MGKQPWQGAIERMLARMEDTARRVGDRFPHWANTESADWVTTEDGDWTGGHWIGMQWLAHRVTPDPKYRSRAERLVARLRSRVEAETVFKAFPFYYGGALGAILAGDGLGRDVALRCAQSLMSFYDPRLGLIPLGRQAEEGGHVGTTETSIDSLSAAPLLFWAAGESGGGAMAEVASRHADRVLGLHLRKNGSFIQSTSLDSETGAVRKHYTHKGFSDSSTWGRAQAWGLLCGVMSYLRCPSEKRWLEAVVHGADWWMARVPADRVAYWDFDDPAIPDTERDTAATAAVTAALLKLAAVAPDGKGAKYRQFAETTAESLVTRYLTPTHPGDARVPGMLTQSCFNKRADSRPQDAARNCEFIVAAYYLLESLVVLAGGLEPASI